MTHFLKAACVGLALCGGAGLALAQSEPDPIQVLLAPTPDGFLVGSIDRSVSGLFVDAFSFIAPAAGGVVTVSFESLAGPVSFFSGLLGDAGFGNVSDDPSAPFSFSTAFGTGGAPLSLTLLGFAGDASILADGLGSYRATVEVQPVVGAVPEPSTYALMLLGLACVAVAAQPSRQPVRV